MTEPLTREQIIEDFTLHKDRDAEARQQTNEIAMQRYGKTISTALAEGVCLDCKIVVDPASITIEERNAFYSAGTCLACFDKELDVFTSHNFM